MNDVNKVILVGKLVRNAELRYTASNHAVLGFTVATNKSYKDKGGNEVKSVVYHSCNLWGKRAEALSQWMLKGRTVFVEGEITQREWADQQGQKKQKTEIQVQDIQLIGGDAQSGHHDQREPGDDSYGF